MRHNDKSAINYGSLLRAAHVLERTARCLDYATTQILPHSDPLAFHTAHHICRTTQYSAYHVLRVCGPCSNPPHSPQIHATSKYIHDSTTVKTDAPRTPKWTTPLPCPSLTAASRGCVPPSRCCAVTSATTRHGQHAMALNKRPYMRLQHILMFVFQHTVLSTCTLMVLFPGVAPACMLHAEGSNTEHRRAQTLGRGSNALVYTRVHVL